MSCLHFSLTISIEDIRTVGIYCFLDVSICIEKPIIVFMAITVKMQLLLLFLNYLDFMHWRGGGRIGWNRIVFYTDNDLASSTVGKNCKVNISPQKKTFYHVSAIIFSS